MIDVDEKPVEKERFDDLSFLLLETSDEALSGLGAMLSSSDGSKLTTVSSVEEALEEIEQKDFECFIVPTEDLSKDDIKGLIDEVGDRNPEVTVFAYVDDFQKISDQEIFSRFDDFISKRYARESPEFGRKRILKTYLDRKGARSTERILERVTDGFAAIDEDDRFVYVNDEAARLWQKPKEELIGGKLWDKFPNILGTPFQKKYEELKGGDEPVYLEEYYEPIDRWLAIKGYPSESGATIYQRDVTERKEREKTLERKITQQEATTDMLRMSLEEGDLVDIQYTAVEKLAETLENDFARIWHIDHENQELELAAEHGMRASEVDEQTLELEERFQEAYSFMKKDSSVIPDYRQEKKFDRTKLMEFLDITSGITVMVGAYEKPWGVLSTFSKEKTTYNKDEIRFVEGIANLIGSAIDNQQKHRKLLHYRKAFKSAGAAIFMVDSDGKILTTNRKFQELTGYSENQLRGRSLSFVIDDNGQEDRKVYLKSSKGGSDKVELIRSPVGMLDGTEGEVIMVMDR